MTGQHEETINCSYSVAGLKIDINLTKETITLSVLSKKIVFIGV